MSRHEPGEISPAVERGDARAWLAEHPARGWRCAPLDPRAKAFHSSLPGYAATPLVDIPSLADDLGIGRLLVKDESLRLGLPAFKVLGVSWGVFRTLADRAGEPHEPASLARLRDLAIRLSPLELVTATDGNHGRALARMAALVGLDAHIFVPDDLRPAAIAAIVTEGATVTPVTGSYDAAVERARDHVAKSANRLLIQDTGWDGYERIPGWIVEGYATLFREIDRQLEAIAGGPVDLVVIPAGVGSLLQAAISHYRSGDQDDPPAVLAVEPEEAACVLASLEAGRLTTIATRHTVMAGLNCGVPSQLAWPAIVNGLDAAVAISDEAALAAMHDLRVTGIDAGPCGAASLAGARAVLTGFGSAARRAALGITGSSTVVLVSTDGQASGAG